MLKKRRKIYHIEHFSELVQHPQQWSAFKDMMRFIVESDGSIDRFERLLMERFMIDFLGVDQKDAILQSDTTNLTLRHVKDQTKLLHHSLSDSLKMVAIQLLFKLALANHTIDKEEIKGIQLIAKIWKISEGAFKAIEAMYSKRADAPYFLLGVRPEERNRSIVRRFKEVRQELEVLSQAAYGLQKKCINERIEALEWGFNQIDERRLGQCAILL